MAPDLRHSRAWPESQLASDFTQRLRESLAAADRNRRRHALLHRARMWLPVLLLIGPLIAWRLMAASPDGWHVAIAFLTQWTFVLDVAVHADTGVLAYLGLQVLPSVLGVLLLVVITAWLLAYPRGDQ